MATNDYIEKDLGIVTAYGEAVAGGYTGTRAQFQELLVRMSRNILDYNEQTNKPQINGVTLQGNKTTSDLGISTTSSYSNLTNKPSINGITLQGNKTSSDLNIISTYESLSNKPSINGVVLQGNKTSSDLGISGIGVRKTKTLNITLTSNNGGLTFSGSSAHGITSSVIMIASISLNGSPAIPALSGFGVNDTYVNVYATYFPSGLTSASASVTLYYYE